MFRKTNKDLYDDLEELKNLNFKESKGEQKIKEDPVCDDSHLQPLN